MRRNTLLISIALTLAVIAAACGSTEPKPAAEPLTPVPTVTVQANDDNAGAGTDSANEGQASLSDPAVRECLEEQLGQSFELESIMPGGDLFGRLGAGELAVLEACGVDVSDGFGGAFGEFGDRRGGGAGAFTAEVQECLAQRLGEDFAGGFGGFGGFGGRDGGTQPGDAPFGGGLGEDFTAALEECGVDLAGGGFGGFGGFGDRGGFGDGGGFGGRGGGFGGFGGGAIQECLADLLGPGGLDQLRSSGGGFSPELREAFEQCGGTIPVEAGAGIGDGAGPISPDSATAVAPTATAVPASDLTIEQLTCLSGALEPAALASVVIATSSGDLSELSDEVLAALATCGFES